MVLVDVRGDEESPAPLAGVLPSSTALFEGRSLARRTTLAIIRIRGAIAHLHGVELPVGICSRRMVFGSGLIVDLERVLPELTELSQHHPNAVKSGPTDLLRVEQSYAIGHH